MGKFEKYEYHLMIGILSLSALLGIGMGYLVFGPLYARTNNEQQGVYYNYDDNIMLAGLMYDNSLHLEQQSYYNMELEYNEVGEMVVCEDEETHSFIVTSYDGYVIILYSEANGKAEWVIHEITTTPVSGLPYEEQERLISGIPVYTEEELIRILQDYES